MNNLRFNLPAVNLDKTFKTRKEAPNLEKLFEFFLCCRNDECSSDIDSDNSDFYDEITESFSAKQSKCLKENGDNKDFSNVSSKFRRFLLELSCPLPNPRRLPSFHCFCIVSQQSSDENFVCSKTNIGLEVGKKTVFEYERFMGKEVSLDGENNIQFNRGEVFWRCFGTRRRYLINI